MQSLNYKILDSISDDGMVLAIVVPCYNEEAVLQEAHNVLSRKMRQLVESKKISPKSFLCFIDDGSKDGTWSILKSLSKENNDTYPPPPVLMSLAELMREIVKLIVLINSIKCNQSFHNQTFCKQAKTMWHAILMQR